MTCASSKFRRWLFALTIGLCLSATAMAANDPAHSRAFCTAKDSALLLKQAIENELDPAGGNGVVSIRAERHSFTLHLRYEGKDWTFLADEPNTLANSFSFRCLQKDGPPALLNALKRIGVDASFAEKMWRPCHRPDPPVSPHVSAPVSTGFALLAYFYHGLLLLLVLVWGFALREKRSPPPSMSGRNAG